MLPLFCNKSNEITTLWQNLDPPRDLHVGPWTTLLSRNYLGNALSILAVGGSNIFIQFTY